MQGDGDGGVSLSASDLVGHLACHSLTDLEGAALAGKVERPFRADPALAVLEQRGKEHEAQFLADLEGRENPAARWPVDGRKLWPRS